MRISKRLIFPVLLAVFIVGADRIFAQQSEDWAVLFPEIPDCERKIQTRNIEDFFTVEAIYLTSAKSLKRMPFQNKQYYCGKISFDFYISDKKFDLKNRDSTPFYRSFKIKNYHAFRILPRCGVGSPGTSIDVYFDENKILRVTDRRDNAAILKFVERADYKKIKFAVNKFVNSIRESNN